MSALFQKPLIILSAINNPVYIDGIVFDLVQNKIPAFNIHLVIFVCGDIRQRFLEKNTQRLILIPLDEALAESLADPNDCFISVESNQEAFDFEEEKLAQAFSELPLMRREVLRLLFVEELTPGEIAKQLHCSQNYVHKQKSRALQKLRTALTGGETDALDEE